jgi:DNA topoisomerase-1
VKLMIVESPNKTAKIAAILGEGWKVSASIGHIRDLPRKSIGVLAPDYKPEYVFTDPRAEEVTERLKGLAARADEVYLATDPDREGEAIAWHLKETLGLRHYQRVTFDAITSDVINKALTKPRQIDDHLVAAQEARRVLDRLVGYQVSPKLSDQTGRRGLSAGRVQSIAVRIVAERERQIKNFKPTKHFGAEVSFDKNLWSAQWKTKPYLAEGEEYILDQGLANRAAQCRNFTVTASGGKPRPEAPPAPFTTSTLLQAASVTLHFDPEKTAQLAQALFAAGLITYHRTDSQNFGDEALSEIRAFAGTKGWATPAKPRKWKPKDGAQEAHEAIRPTHLEHLDAGETEEQRALYRLIWVRAVASQLADAEYHVSTVELEATDAAGTFQFVATGRTMTNPGWRALTPKDAADEADEESEEAKGSGKVPILKTGLSLTAESGRVLNKSTKAPSRFTKASLIKQLENMGIGRPSTYAAIIKNIMEREYLNESKKYLIPTEVGYLIVDSLVGNFAFAEYDFTKDLEESLDHIAEGQADYRTIVGNVNDRLCRDLGNLKLQRSSLANSTPSTGGPQSSTGVATCPSCKKGTVQQIKSAKGTFWGCSAYQKEGGCKFSIDGMFGKKTHSEAVIKQLCEKLITTQVIKGLQNKDGKKYDAKLKLNENFKVQPAF